MHEQLDRLRVGDHQFLGRDDVLAELDEWLLSSDSPIAVLTADAGYGKTAVAKQWLGRLRKVQTRILVHSFSGQSNAGDESTLQALGELCEAVVDAQDAKCFPIAPERLVGAIVQSCRARPTILVLDGFETQQDSDGRVAFQSLAMEDLLVQLAEVAHCRVLLTTRRHLHLPAGIIQAKRIDVGPLRDEEVFDLFTLSRNDLSANDANALVTRFFAGGGHPLTVALLLDVLQDPSNIASLLELDSGAPLESLLERIYDSLSVSTRHVVELVALTGQPVRERDLATQLQILGELTQPETLPKLVLRESLDDTLDMHPLVRRIIGEFARKRDPDYFAKLQSFLARSCETAAGNVSRARALPLLWRALQHHLQAKDMAGALNIYLFSISREPHLSDKRFGKAWHSVMEDFAYELEGMGLNLLLEQAYWRRSELAPLDVNFHKHLLMRQLWVDRALGRMSHADALGQRLWQRKIFNEDPSETLGQICLTTMICGRILRNANSSQNSRYAGYWSALALEHAGSLPEHKRSFPLVRSLVYQGAYLHRAGLWNDAQQAFNKAIALQAKIRLNDPAQPPVLVGVNAYLYIWFLIDAGELVAAADMVERNLNFLGELRKTPGSWLAERREKQWRLIADLASVWLNQEQALKDAATNDFVNARKHYRKAAQLLLEIDGTIESQRDAIAYDLRSTYTRAQMRQHALRGDPQLAERELKRNVENYDRSGARMFAADCQCDLLRLYQSAGSFKIRGWTPPTNSVQRAAAVRLSELSRHYPLAQIQWVRQIPLRDLEGS